MSLDLDSSPLSITYKLGYKQSNLRHFPFTCHARHSPCTRWCILRKQSWAWTSSSHAEQHGVHLALKAESSMPGLLDWEIVSRGLETFACPFMMGCQVSLRIYMAPKAGAERRSGKEVLWEWVPTSLSDILVRRFMGVWLPWIVFPRKYGPLVFQEVRFWIYQKSARAWTFRDNSLMEAPKLVSVKSESSKHKAATCFNLQLLLDRKLDEQLTEARTCERICRDVHQTDWFIRCGNSPNLTVGWIHTLGSCFKRRQWRAVSYIYITAFVDFR